MEKWMELVRKLPFKIILKGNFYFNIEESDKIRQGDGAFV